MFPAFPPHKAIDHLILQSVMPEEWKFTIETAIITVFKWSYFYADRNCESSFINPVAKDLNKRSQIDAHTLYIIPNNANINLFVFVEC